MPERVDHTGMVLVPLDEAAARDALRALVDAGVESIAVCLMHSYANPAHEKRIAELAAEVCPGVMAGSDKSKILIAQVWISDMRLFAEMNAVWDAWADQESPPVRACSAVELGHPDMKVEVIITAAVAGAQ